MIYRISLSGILLLCISCIRTSEENRLQNTLWYPHPALEWVEALPVGNGRFGGMVFGDPRHERIQLNEDSLWPGGPDWGNSKGTPEDLSTIRHLLIEGDHQEADRLLVEKFSYKSIVRSHQTLGDLWIDFGERNVDHYQRRLNLDSALATVQYLTDGYAFSEVAFCSAPDQALVVHMESEHPDGFTCAVTLNRPDDTGYPTAKTTSFDENTLIMSGEVTQRSGILESGTFPIEHGVRFEVRLKAIHLDGNCSVRNDSLIFSMAKKVTLVIVAGTSWYEQDLASENMRKLAAINEKPIQTLLKDHVDDHQSLFTRVRLNLGNAELDSLSTGERLTRIQEGNPDPGMEAMLFQFGRYLLIGSSRPGTNPANLQGIWNEHITAPWNADYHLNINLQMNYWPAEVANLSELHEPLFDFIDRLRQRGRITAGSQYGMPGFVVHHATDLWAPAWMRSAQAYWGSWVHGGGWLMQHLWEHFQFTRDTAFLKARALPALRECAEFYNAWLMEDPRDGSLISSPSTSPENSFIAPNGLQAASCLGSAVDQQIIREVFTNTITASEILEVEDEFIQTIRSKRDRMRSGTVIGPDGRLLEWDRPYEEVEKGHRHLSHLYAFHPGNEITADGTPELFDAVKKTLQFRLDHGGAGTGWSRAWLINLSARLQDGDMAHEHVQQLFAKSILPNLFDAHPPFQIDGNFGYTAGIAEMLLQSHQDCIHILPALPSAWPEGSVHGLKARGNYEIAMKWENNVLVEALIHSVNGGTTCIRYGDETRKLTLKKGEVFRLTP